MRRTLALALLFPAGCGEDDSGQAPLPDGAWRDPACGLTWQQEPGEAEFWNDAVAACEALDLAGGGWHLPDIGELRCLVLGCEATAPDGACEVSADCPGLGCVTTACEGCESGAGASEGCWWPEALGGACAEPLWSSTPLDEKRSWLIDFGSAALSADAITEKHAVLCTRAD